MIRVWMCWAGRSSGTIQECSAAQRTRQDSGVQQTPTTYLTLVSEATEWHRDVGPTRSECATSANVARGQRFSALYKARNPQAVMVEEFVAARASCISTAVARITCGLQYEKCLHGHDR
jgi:hypothetical protein